MTSKEFSDVLYKFDLILEGQKVDWAFKVVVAYAGELADRFNIPTGQVEDCFEIIIKQLKEERKNNFPNTPKASA